MLFVAMCVPCGAAWAQAIPAAPAPVVVVSSTEPEAASDLPRRIGGGVSAPVLLNQVAPVFSEQARSQRVSGSVLVNLQVDVDGNPAHLRVLRGVGYGLDESAVEAVRQYKFKPAMEDGKPVRVELNVEVNFAIDGRSPKASASPTSVIPATNLMLTDAELANPKVLSAWKDAKQYEVDRNIAAAVDDYKKANKAAGGSCIACLKRVYGLSIKMGQFKEAAQASAQLAAVAQSPVEKSNAENDEAQALYLSDGDKPKPAQLQAVDDLLKAALKDDGRNNPARYLDGRVLAQMGRMDDARAQFAACLAAASPKDPTYGRVKRFADNPELSFQKRAPAFTVTALDGSKFNLDDMGGRVVLIDFWATWCGPCNEELPHIKKIAKEFAGQPLVILSISWDADAKKWKDFIAKNEMTWPQYRDADQDLTRRFGISAIPHYFTIDSDGVLTSEMLGSGSDVEGKLRKLVVKAKKAQETQQAQIAGGTSTGAAAN